MIRAVFGPEPGDRDAAFYSYAAPEPPGFSQAAIRPDAAFYSAQFSEYLLMYEDVRKAESPRDVLLAFFQTVYDMGATLGNWDRASLDRPPDPE